MAHPERLSSPLRARSSPLRFDPEGSLRPWSTNNKGTPELGMPLLLAHPERFERPTLRFVV